MIVSFYDKNFKGLQNNASLVAKKDSFSLIKRPVEMNTLNCICEPFTEDIQPTFLVIQDDKGGYIYGCLAGVPLLNQENQTEINGTDLKSMLSSDVILTPGTYTTVNQYINYLFAQWQTQVNQGSFATEIEYNSNVGSVAMTDLKPTTEKAIYNAYEELAKYLKRYDLFIDTEIDLINKKVIFTIGKTMFRTLNIKLWEHGIKNYGKWVADVNECQGYYKPKDATNWNENAEGNKGYKWILTKENNITITESERNIFPIKRKVIISEESLAKANEESLTELLNSLYNENIDLNADEVLQQRATLETKFVIYTKQGQPAYKELPCGELQYDANGLKRVQIGYRYSGVEFI